MSESESGDPLVGRETEDRNFLFFILFYCFIFGINTVIGTLKPEDLPSFNYVPGFLIRA